MHASLIDTDPYPCKTGFHVKPDPNKQTSIDSQAILDDLLIFPTAEKFQSFRSSAKEIEEDITVSSVPPSFQSSFSPMNDSCPLSCISNALLTSPVLCEPDSQTVTFSPPSLPSSSCMHSTLSTPRFSFLPYILLPSSPPPPFSCTSSPFSSKCTSPIPTPPVHFTAPSTPVSSPIKF